MVSTTACPIAISYKDFSSTDENRFVKVLAHEIAHFLGLFHISDDYSPLGITDDRIEDTSLAESTTNVMHKTSEVFDIIQFTPGQLKALKSNPMLYK